MPHAQLKENFCILFESAFKDCLCHLSQALAEGKNISSYFNFPMISYNENGMPRFYQNPFGGPKDYKNAFRSNGFSITPEPALVQLDQLDSFKTLFTFISEHDYLKLRFMPKEMFSPVSDATHSNSYDFFTFSIKYTIETLADRYIHINNNAIYDEASYREIVVPFFNCLFEDKLYVDICVPILFLKFDFDTLSLAKNNIIQKMDDPFQLARASKSAYGPGVHQSVLPAATHMFVMRGWYIPNQNQWQLANLLSDSSVYPLEIIDKFFASLRILTGAPTGYAQVLMRPVGWAKTFLAGLPPIEGTSIRAYPPRFENYYWNVNDIPTIDFSTATKIVDQFDKLAAIPENSVKVALRRLNRCFMRETEEDTVLDATIGLEALLSDDERQEMTHKLAMRIAALSKLSSKFPHSPSEVLKTVKSIYAYRSAVVHGSTKVDKKRVIQFVDKTSKEASLMGVEYLRLILEILIEHPKFRAPMNIDKFLLEGCLAN